MKISIAKNAIKGSQIVRNAILKMKAELSKPNAMNVLVDIMLILIRLVHAVITKI
jgi:hypothetical protein